jgi:hypothetical protein
MPKIIKPKLVILSVPKVGMKDAKVSKNPVVKTGEYKTGEYKGSGSNKYWYSYEPTILCVHCKKGFHTTKERTRHQRSHDEPKDCPHCNYRNVRQDHLTDHIRAVHNRSLAVVKHERQLVRNSDPLYIPPIRNVTKKKQKVPTKVITQSVSVSCQTTFNSDRMILSSDPSESVDDCVETESTDKTSTKFSQTVSVIRVSRGYEQLVVNPHPSQIQDVLSFKKIKLSDLQKAVRWENCGRKKANNEYRTNKPIVLPVHKDELPNDVEYLKLLVMQLGVRANVVDTENYYLKTKLASLSPVDKFV